MKFKKIGAVAAAALVMTSFAMSASAASLPEGADPNLNAASVRAVDVDLSAIDWDSIQPGELKAIGEIDPGTVSVTYTVSQDGEAGLATVVAVKDVGLSKLELTNLEEGELIALGPVDMEAAEGTITCGVVAASKCAASLEEVSVDLYDVEGILIEAGDPVIIGSIDPDTAAGAFTTQAKPVE